MNFKYCLTALLLLGYSSTTLAEDSTSKIHAAYSITRAGQAIGEVSETLAIAKGQYQLDSTTIPVGVLAVFVKDVIKKTSAGMYDRLGFHPEHYTYQRSTKPKKNIQAQFDWKKQTATFQYDGKTETQALPQHLQDLLSLGYQLRHWPKPQDTLQLPVSNGKKISEYQLTRVGEETVTVPAGTFQATRFMRALTPDDDGITVWVSDQVAAPVKIIYEEKKGILTEQVLIRITSE